MNNVFWILTKFNQKQEAEYMDGVGEDMVNPKVDEKIQEGCKPSEAKRRVLL